MYFDKAAVIGMLKALCDFIDNIMVYPIADEDGNIDCLNPVILGTDIFEVLNTVRDNMERQNGRTISTGPK
jgi:hypothetical protein